MTTPKPELGAIKAGDLVYVQRSPNDMRGRPESERYIPARVTKAARIWIELEAEDRPEGRTFGYTWRMRRDTQNEGTRYPGSDTSFVTPAQREHHDREREARVYLRQQGIRVERWSQELGSNAKGAWYGREAELADLLRAHEEKS